MSKQRKTLALDFDGVLHHYTGWNDGKLDGPEEGAVEFCRQAVEHFKVYVVSSRCNTEIGQEAILNWLCKYGFPEEMTVTAERPPAYVSLDDRAVTFTGTWPEMHELLNFQPWWKVDREHGEIPMVEMQKRGDLIASNQGREYGIAMAVVSSDPLPAEMLTSTKTLVERNFHEHAKTTPGLVDWAFVTGPVKDVWRFEDCVNLADPEDDHCSKGVDCPSCDGFGRVPVEIIEGRKEYSFGWYSIVANP
jgi:hypothetical protein